jgi:hypothetical protein
MGLPDEKFLDEMCDMNNLYLGIEILCKSCGQVIHPADTPGGVPPERVLFNRESGIVIHYRCYVNEVNRISFPEKGIES